MTSPTIIPTITPIATAISKPETEATEDSMRRKSFAFKKSSHGILESGISNFFVFRLWIITHPAGNFHRCQSFCLCSETRLKRENNHISQALEIHGWRDDFSLRQCWLARIQDFSERRPHAQIESLTVLGPHLLPPPKGSLRFCPVVVLSERHLGVIGSGLRRFIACTGHSSAVGCVGRFLFQQFPFYGWGFCLQNNCSSVWQSEIGMIRSSSGKRFQEKQVFHRNLWIPTGIYTLQPEDNHTLLCLVV